MNVNELIETLSQIKENGYGKLPVAIKEDDTLGEANLCEIKVSDDTVGLYVEIEK